jgi:hypothetical protein
MKLDLKRKPQFAARRPRKATFITTAILLPDDREVFVDIRNISPSGFMALSDSPLSEGTRFGVAVPGRGIIRAEVRWAMDDMFGAQFDHPLELQEIDG